MNPSTIVLLVIVLLALPVLRIVFKALLRRFAGGVVLKAIGEDALAKQPEKIHLVPLTASAWKNPGGIDRLAEPLLARGFSAAGDYSIPELSGVLVRFLMDRARGVFACLYEHPKAGTWMELVSRYQDGTGATFTMMRDRGIQHRPQNLVVHAPGSAPGELLDRMLRERPNRPLAPLSAEKIVQLFEDAYREQLAWQKNKGGLSAKEVAGVITTRENRA
jgi:hypothetical protein